MQIGTRRGMSLLLPPPFLSKVLQATNFVFILEHVQTCLIVLDVGFLLSVIFLNLTGEYHTFHS
jgi:hypothetical protein